MGSRWAYAHHALDSRGPFFPASKTASSSGRLPSLDMGGPIDDVFSQATGGGVGGGERTLNGNECWLWARVRRLYLLGPFKKNGIPPLPLSRSVCLPVCPGLSVYTSVCLPVSLCWLRNFRDRPRQHRRCQPDSERESESRPRGTGERPSRRPRRRWLRSGREWETGPRSDGAVAGSGRGGSVSGSFGGSGGEPRILRTSTSNSSWGGTGHGRQWVDRAFYCSAASNEVVGLTDSELMR
jgi:hypothetical protein